MWSSTRSVASPGPRTRKRVDVDPITLRVLGGAFHAIAKEMAGVLFRMSYSSIIRESEDLGAGIFDAQGRELCESDSTPMHIGSLPWYIRGFLHRLGGETSRKATSSSTTTRTSARRTRRRGGRGADHLPGRAARLRRRHGARARRRRLVPGINADAFDVYAEAKMYNALRWYRRRRAERRRRSDDLRQRPDGDDEPRRHERDARRLPARARSLPAARPALRRRGRDERRLRVDGLLGEDAPRRDREDPRRGVRPDRRLARRRRAEPGRAPPRRDEGDRRGRRDHDRPHRLEPGGAHRLQRPVRRVAPRRGLLRGADDSPRRGGLPRARPPERRRLPPGQRDRPEGDDLQPELPAGLLLALHAGATGRRQHHPRAGGRPAGQGHRAGTPPGSTSARTPASTRPPASTGSTSR